MDKRFVLFLVLAMAIIALNQAIVIMLAPPRPAQQAKANAKGAAADKGKPDKPKPAAEQKAPVVKPAEAKQAVPVEEAKVAPRWLTIGSADPAGKYRMLVTLTNVGAAVEAIELSDPGFRDIDNRSGYLGRLAAADAPDGGCLVRVVGPGTPADRAGLKSGDEIVRLDGVKVQRAVGLYELLAQTKPGQQASLSIVRDGKPQDLSVALGRRPVQIVRPEFDAQPLDVVDPKKHDPLSLLLTLQQLDNQTLGDNDEELKGVDLQSGTWEVAESDAGQVAFRKALPELKLEVIKRFRLAKGPANDPNAPAYHLTLSIEVHNRGTGPRNVAYRLRGPTGVVLEGAWYASKLSRNWSGAGLRDLVVRYEGQDDLELSSVHIADGKKLDTQLNPSISYVAVDAQYFTAALVPQTHEDGAPWFAELQAQRVGAVPAAGADKRKTNVSFWLASRAEELAPGGKPLLHEYQLFAGPKRPKLLAEYRPPRPADARQAPSLESLVYHGWPIWAVVARPLTALLHLFYALVGNYGIAIVMLTLLVRGCMYPVTRKQTISGHKMQQISPELKRLREKHKNDTQALIKAQRELFHKHQFSQWSGCMPALIQLPIFIGLYRGLMVDVELRQASLISDAIRWCSNLAAPDMLADWSAWMPVFIMHWLGPFLNILPIATVGLFIWQQKVIMPPPADEQAAMQQKIMKYMMVVMAILFYKVASGLCIYFISSTIWSIFERKLLLPKPAAAGSAEPVARTYAPAPGGNGAAGKGRSRARRGK